MEETGQPTAFDEDPAAAFMAREQEDLAGIADDTLGSGLMGAPVAAPTGEGLLDGGSDLFGTAVATETPPAPASQDLYSAISSMDQTSSEPECIRQWREEQRQHLAEKDAEETAELDELRKAAQKELQDWYNHYEEQLGHTKTSNRQAEEVFVEERDSDVPGHEWERVARLCDFNPKNNKNTKDVSRMRSLFLQLKQTPPVH